MSRGRKTPRVNAGSPLKNANSAGFTDEQYSQVEAYVLEGGEISSREIQKHFADISPLNILPIITELLENGVIEPSASGGYQRADDSFEPMDNLAPQ